MIPELERLIIEAQNYLLGKIHYSELSNYVISFYKASKFGVHPSIRSLALDWNDKMTQLWPEFAQVEQISEEQFKEWVSEQLLVFKEIILEELQNEINRKV